MEEKQSQSANSNATRSSSGSSPKSIFGTADHLSYKASQRHLDLADYKFGYNEIDPAYMNIQGVAYGIGGIDMYPEAETLTVHFIIPRRDEVLKHTFTREELDEQRFRLKLIIERATAPEPELNPNPEACKYCGVRASCKALADKMLPIAKKYASSSEAFEVALFENLDPTAIDNPDTLNKMMQVAGVVENWGLAVKAEALKKAIEEGVQYPDFDLQYRRPSFTFQGTEMLAVCEAVAPFLSDEELAQACKTSISELTKALSAKLPRGEKNTARGKIESALLRASLVPEDDEIHMTPYLRRKRNLKK